MEHLYFGMTKTNSQNYKKGQKKKKNDILEMEVYLKELGGNVTGIHRIFGIRVSPTRGIWCRVDPAAEFC